MQQFIPFEDDWDALEHLRPEALIPYRVGLLRALDLVDRRTGLPPSSTVNSSPSCAPVRCAVPADSSSTLPASGLPG
jgi:hypothetical protein